MYRLLLLSVSVVLSILKMLRGLRTTEERSCCRLKVIAVRLLMEDASQDIPVIMADSSSKKRKKWSCCAFQVTLGN